MLALHARLASRVLPGVYQYVMSKNPFLQPATILCNFDFKTPPVVPELLTNEDISSVERRVKPHGLVSWATDGVPMPFDGQKHFHQKHLHHERVKSRLSAGGYNFKSGKRWALCQPLAFFHKAIPRRKRSSLFPACGACQWLEWFIQD